ncbi:hypothetical protein P4O66_004767 [Electrophorus voltai]|uniref:Uncharacterized protein n=1 Tax=Electrophorus voltai TaxID=2609070 RepID=A0AAD8YPL0_9TELE|nr:hypothetical protein P4O66_004767 [Electrophorus voltai]
MHPNNQKEGGWVDPSGSPAGRAEARVPSLQRTQQRDWRGLPNAPEANRRWDAPRVSGEWRTFGGGSTSGTGADVHPRMSIEAMDTYKDQFVTIYTDSCYAFGVVHDLADPDARIGWNGQVLSQSARWGGRTGQGKAGQGTGTGTGTGGEREVQVVEGSVTKGQHARVEEEAVLGLEGPLSLVELQVPLQSMEGGKATGKQDCLCLLVSMARRWSLSLYLVRVDLSFGSDRVLRSLPSSAPCALFVVFLCTFNDVGPLRVRGIECMTERSNSSSPLLSSATQTPELTTEQGKPVHGDNGTSSAQRAPEQKEGVTERCGAEEDNQGEGLTRPGGHYQNYQILTKNQVPMSSAGIPPLLAWLVWCGTEFGPVPHLTDPAWCYKTNKNLCPLYGNQSHINQTSDQTQRESGADPDLDAAPPRAPQLIQQPQALANPPPYPQPGTSSTPKPSPYDELRRQLEAITSPVAHRTRSHTPAESSTEPEVGYAPQFPMLEVSGPEGVIMVHRHWTTDDIMKAADGLSKPGDIGGRRFGQELMAFVQSCRPTQAELRRLLMMRKRQRKRKRRGKTSGWKSRNATTVESLDILPETVRRRITHMTGAQTWIPLSTNDGRWRGRTAADH